MARQVFFSFHYENDVSRAMVTRNSWVTQGKKAAGFVDKAEFEKIKQRGDKAIKDWINEQLEGTSVTVVLIGENTLDREYVKYEICQSINRGNAIIGVKIHQIKDMATQKASSAGNVSTVVGSYKDGRQFNFNSIADSVNDYISDDGYNNMGAWIEAAAKKHGK